MHYKVKQYKLKTRRRARKLEKKYRDHPRLVPMLAGLAVLAIVFVLLFTLRDSNPVLKKLDDAHIVVLHVDRESRVIPTREETVGEFLENADIAINEGDVVEPGLDAAIEEDDFRINVYRAVPVLVDVEGHRQLTMSAAQTPRSILDQAGIDSYPEDLVKARPSEDFLKEGIGSVVTITRSTPIGLNLYGTSLATRTVATTVEGLLKEKGVKLAEGDNVQPSPNTPLAGVSHVFVSRAGVKIVTSEEAIPMPVEKINDNSLSLGSQVIRQRGSAGKKSLAYEITTVNGREVRKLIQEIVIVEPVKQIVARGTLVNIPADKSAVMTAAGIPVDQQAYASYIITRESRWNASAQNASSGAYGLCQALPGSKMASAGSDWRTNPITQLKWCTGYANGRYGSWHNAYEFWLSRHWW